MSRKYNCTVHGKPMYRVRAKIGNDLNGKAIFKSFYGDGKVEAEQKRNRYLEARLHSPSAMSNDSLGKLADFYTYNILTNTNLAKTTIALYESQYRLRLKDSKISILPIAELSSFDLQSYLNRQNISNSAMSALSKYLKHLFSWLSDQGYCNNIMDKVIVPSKEQKTDDISVFTQDEIDRIVNTENRLNLAFRLALSTGLRLGELLALKYSDISNGIVHVTKQLTELYEIDGTGYRERKKIIRKPKSKNSTRIVPLPDRVAEHIEPHLEAHKKEQADNGYSTEYMFTTSSGGFIDRTNFHRAWQRHLKKAGVDYKKFHTCRSTYCTLLCKNGVNIETASKLMGHSSVAVTAQFYRMIDDDELTSAACKINDVF